MFKLYKEYYCVYRIDVGNKYYYGSTKHMHIRYRDHKNRLLNNKHENKIIQHAFNKYQKFNMIVVAAFETDIECRNFEQKYLDCLNIGDNKKCMNISQNVDKIVCGPLSRKHKENLSIAARKKPRMTEKTKRKISESKKGTVISEEQRKKQSKSMRGKHSGKDNPMYGTKSPMAKIITLTMPNKEKLIFDSIFDAANHINVPYTTLYCWISGRSEFPGQTKIKVSKYKHLIGLTASYIGEA